MFKSMLLTLSRLVLDPLMVQSLARPRRMEEVGSGSQPRVRIGPSIPKEPLGGQTQTGQGCSKVDVLRAPSTTYLHVHMHM